MWALFDGKEFNPTEEELKKWAGFVYIIHDLTNGKMYIGKKTFWSRKTLPPLKGKTRKRRSIVESDWRNYYGSNEEIKQYLVESGEKRFYRKILHFCKTKGEMSHLEAKEQFNRNVLTDDQYYNGIINCKIHRSHVQGLKKCMSIEQK
jgi:hypothetical protein